MHGEMHLNCTGDNLPRVLFCLETYNNTFRAPNTPVKIRGVPQDKCDVHHNWFLKHSGPEEAVKGLSAKTKAFNNVYGNRSKAAVTPPASRPP